jgi:maltoporin
MKMNWLLEKRSTFSAVVLAAAATCVADVALAASPTHEIGTNGYFRTGIGTSDGGSGQASFKAPGAGAKYRLGNENDTYLEVRLFDTIRLSGTEGPYVKVVGLGNFYVGSTNAALPFGNVGELYMEVGNVTSALGNPSVWAGRPGAKFASQIHINDYFLLSNGWFENADGVGIRDLDPGLAGRLDVMVLRTKTPSLTTSTDVSQTTADVKWRDIPVNPGGKLKVWGLYTGSNGPAETVATTGWSAGVFHEQANVLGGVNRFGVQYGRGLGRSAGALFNVFADSSLGQVTTEAQADALEKAATFRLTDELVIEPSKQWSLGVGVVYEDKKSVEFDGKTQTWFSVGARPYYYFNEHFRMALEAGNDRVSDRAASGAAGSLMKVTIAPELALARGFWSRPVIRFFGTYAAWSEEFKGLVGGAVYANATSGWSVGSQIETWW